MVHWLPYKACVVLELQVYQTANKFNSCRIISNDVIDTNHCTLLQILLIQ